MRKHVSVVMAAAATALFALGTVPTAHAAPAAPSAPVDPALAAIPSGPLTFGAEALASAREAAAGAAAGASCAITTDTATALALAPVWAEVVAGTMATPSPMTLSRYDTQPGLYDPAGREGLFFNPGVGLWQMDSAGLGSRNTAGEAIDSRWVSATVVPYIVGRYCTALNGGSAAPAARAAAWRDWNACADGDCDTAFWRAVNNGIGADPSVDRHGGARPRTCSYGGATYDCLFVDVADAQGATWWAAPGGGRSPVPHPFYVLRTETGGASQEVRVWLAQDSGHGVHVSVTRPFGADARTSLSWSDGDGLCDTTTGRGDC